MRRSLSSISASLLSDLRTPDQRRVSGHGQAVGESVFPSFIAEEAATRRKKGEDPDVYLKIVECCRRSYLDLIHEATLLDPGKAEAALLLDRSFNRIALGFCREWSSLVEEDLGSLKRDEQKARHLYGMNVLAEFASGVAHEVRNPLHALLSVTEALKQELKDNPDADIYLCHIRNQIDRLSQLMKDLLQVGKPVEPSRIRGEFLSSICLAAINAWKSSSSAEGHTISFIDRPEGEGIRVLADGLSLQQALLNLLDNAAQYSPVGSDIEITISDPGKKFVKIRVIDRGSGIPQECRQKIFEPFFSTRRGGTGLGLTVVKNVLKSQGGSIIIWNNDPLPGATAEISVPLAEGEQE